MAVRNVIDNQYVQLHDKKNVLDVEKTCLMKKCAYKLKGYMQHRRWRLASIAKLQDAHDSFNEVAKALYDPLGTWSDDEDVDIEEEEEEVAM